MERILQSGLVTIAIPAYKSKWLPEAIDSALNQDYNNIELVIVDDHSPYDLKTIVLPYLKDKRVRYYYNESNLGKDSIVYNWNKCVDLANGEFFVLLCDDDILLPNFVSGLIKLAEKYPYCNVFHGRRTLLNDMTGQKSEENPWPEYEDFSTFLKAEYYHQRKHTITEFLYRTSILKTEKFEIFPVGYFSDNATILKLAKNGGIASSSEVVCMFRYSTEHISSNKKFTIGKAKAALLYYNWYQNTANTSLSTKKKNNLLDIWMTYFYKEANLWGKIELLGIIPHEIWGYKRKLFMFLSLVGIIRIIDILKSN